MRKILSKSRQKYSGTGRRDLSRCLYRNSQQFWGGQMQTNSLVRGSEMFSLD